MKKSPTGFDKTAVFTKYVKTSGRFFQIFVAFSEKLDFTIIDADRVTIWKLTYYIEMETNMKIN